MTRLQRIGLAALAIGAVTLPVAASTPASAVGEPAIVISLPARAQLSPTGKLVRLRVQVTCSNMDPVPITVHLSQTRSQTKINGTGTSGTDYRCTGRTKTVPVIVSANAGRFNVGGATATATATCGSTTCATDTRNVQLIRPAG
jgi:hypothetical protein